MKFDREWIFKYEPETLDEMILKKEKREILGDIIDNLPNTLLAGKPGTGKGTFMNVLQKKTGCTILKINASMENRIDDVREKVNNFAKSYDPTNKKIVYLNECDFLTASSQGGLRQLIEDTEKITRFFFVCNDETKIVDAIKSRCGYHLDLNDPPAQQILAKCVKILKNEGVKVKDKHALLDLIKKGYPDIRKIIGTMQSNVRDGVLDKISFSTTHDLFAEMFEMMKNTDIEGLRKTLRSNYIQYSDFYNFLYTQIIDNPDLVKKPGEFVILTGEYLFRDSSVAIKEVNFMAYFFEMMKSGVL